MADLDPDLLAAISAALGGKTTEPKAAKPKDPEISETIRDKIASLEKLVN